MTAVAEEQARQFDFSTFDPGSREDCDRLDAFHRPEYLRLARVSRDVVMNNIGKAFTVWGDDFEISDTLEQADRLGFSRYDDVPYVCGWLDPDTIDGYVARAPA